MVKYSHRNMEEKMGIIKVKDSLGNIFNNPVDQNGGSSIFVVKNELHCGEKYSVEIEVDPSYSKDQYNIVWEGNDGKEGAGIAAVDRSRGDNAYLRRDRNDKRVY